MIAIEPPKRIINSKLSKTKNAINLSYISTNVRKLYLAQNFNVFDMSAEDQLLENWLSENERN